MKKNIVITILVVLVLGLGCFIIYDKVIDKKDKNENLVEEKIENKDEEKNDKITEFDVPITDTYAFGVNNYSSGSTIEFYILNNGKLYYKIVKDWITDQSSDVYTYDYNSASYKTKELTEYTKLTNIKRIKGVNSFSTGVAFNLLLITEDGKVYTLDLDNNYDLVLAEATEFSDYEVADVLEYNKAVGCGSPSCYSNHKILLKDGSIVTTGKDKKR